MSKRNEDTRLLIENFDIFQSALSSLNNLALAQFEWHDLPESIDRWYMEKTLFQSGSVAIYHPKDTPEGFYMATGWVQRSGLFNAYGYPTDIWGVDYNGKQIEVDEFYILYDNNDRTPIWPRIEMKAKELYEVTQTFRTNLRHQNTPYIVATTKRQQLSVKNFFTRLFSFDPVIEVMDGQSGDITDSIKSVKTDVPFIGVDLLAARDIVWKQAIQMLGIASETTKRERMLQDELSMNRMESSIAANARLLNRMEFCNMFNEKHGTDISVNISDVVVGFEETDRGQSSQPADDQEDEAQ